MTTQLTRAELRELLDRDSSVLLVEALPEKYYRGGHLPGARHLPHDQVADKAAAVLPDRDARIVVYCASSTCQNSHIAARHLARLGYTRVAVFPGGKQEWVESGLALEPAAATAAA
jgi:rhodanese-related sulfurtransferase